MHSTVIRSHRLVLGTLASVSILGCDVHAPDVVQPTSYESAAGATTLAAGAVTQFHRYFGAEIPGFNGGGVGQVVLSGQMADEYFATDDFLANAGDWDRRDPTDPPLRQGAFYEGLQNTRVNAVQAIGMFKRVAPDSAARIGQLHAMVGYTEVFFAENFCAGVLLSSLDSDLRPVYGPPLTTQQMLEAAVADFDSALKYAADSVRVLNMARVGKARALVNLGRFADAAAAVAAVPTNYVYNVTFVTGTLHNGPFSNGQQNFFTIPEREGINGMNWRAANDPRVQLVNRSPALRGRDNVTEVWAFVPYEATNAPIPLASGKEARLIEAEAALQAGNTTLWLSSLNALRTTVPGLAPLTDPGTAAGRVDLMFRERAFWLFLTGHRHGDMRRLVRQYARSAESVFPTGAWRSGLSYGSALNMAPPSSESPNPNYVGCLDRNA